LSFFNRPLSSSKAFRRWRSAMLVFIGGLAFTATPEFFQSRSKVVLQNLMNQGQSHFFVEQS